MNRRLNKFLDSKEIILLLDSDIFLTEHFSICNYLEEFDLAYVEQTRDNNITYMWPGLVFLDLVFLCTSMNVLLNTTYSHPHKCTKRKDHWCYV